LKFIAIWAKASAKTKYSSIASVFIRPLEKLQAKYKNPQPCEKRENNKKAGGKVRLFSFPRRLPVKHK